MLNKLSFLAGVGAGYVLGARGGRGQYDALKHRSTSALQNPSVQSKIADAAQAVKAQTPPQAHGLVDKAVSAVSGGTAPATSTSTSSSTYTTGVTPATGVRTDYTADPVGMPNTPSSTGLGTDGRLA
ncbi:hypothetical protein [Arsenicicoccus sp. UBA7492]|uniref:hypothetical protein n=1 Tax=Arsenicicoccus sp. UBA7492 TaxID=1946057 RepID=UPI00257FBF9E|nr:hypothetical protein [Arsenicicoccus sp. UBA7492]